MSGDGLITWSRRNFKPIVVDGGGNLAQTILNQSFNFSIRLMEMVHYLQLEEKEFPLTERLLNCSNQIGINMRLASTTSAKEQYSRYSLAFEAATECAYLLSLMEKTGYLTEREAAPIQ